MVPEHSTRPQTFVQQSPKLRSIDLGSPGRGFAGFAWALGEVAEEVLVGHFYRFAVVAGVFKKPIEEAAGLEGGLAGCGGSVLGGYVRLGGDGTTFDVEV